MLNFTLDEAAISLHLNSAFTSAYISRLGGAPALMLTVSLDARSAWVNGILENSRYAKLMISEDGVIENFSGSLPKMRKARAADAEGVVAKINAWLARVSA